MRIWLQKRNYRKTRMFTSRDSVISGIKLETGKERTQKSPMLQIAHFRAKYH